MLTWGFLLLVGGFIACLIFFFSNMTDIIGHIQSVGFGGYVSKFFDPDTLSTAKVAFVIVALLTVLGLVLYIIGRIRNHGSEEKNPIVPPRYPSICATPAASSERSFGPTSPPLCATPAWCWPCVRSPLWSLSQWMR